MFKKALLIAATAACGIASASTSYISVSGQFSGSDVANSLVAPNGTFSLSFAVDNNPVPTSGSVTSLGFDLPGLAFSYELNGNNVPVTPSEIRFNTGANGGLFDVTVGSGLNASEFDFQGDQLFGGTTSAPTFANGTFALTGFTYSDPSNFDVQTPTSASVSVTATPEPSSILLILSGLAATFIGVARRKSKAA
jgi:PEP-CTERM motif